jgi:hypothetical protein
MSTVTRAPVVFRGGWLPTPEHLKVSLTPHLKAISVPVSVDNYSGVPFWGMLGNDEWGDCTCAGDGHIVCQQTALGDNSEIRPTDSQAVTVYEQSGFDPNAGPPGENPTDNGWTVQAALDYLRTKGWPGSDWKIAAYGSVDVSNHNAVRQAAYEFGCLSIGFDVPESAMEQFNAGQPWTPVAGSPIEGGHCVIVVGYDRDWVYIITWGTVWKMSWSFWDTYVSEAHAVIAKDWQSKSGLSLTAFGAEFAAMFGGGNPFDGPAPSPTPAPSNNGCLPGFLVRLFVKR